MFFADLLIMPHQRDFALAHCTSVLGTTKVKCNICLDDVNRGIYHFKWHLAKEQRCETTPCPKCPIDVTYQAKQALQAYSDGKAKKARIAVEVASNFADARGNPLDEATDGQVFRGV